MARYHQDTKNSTFFNALLGGLLIGLPALSIAADAAPVRGCPGIYYEEPFNNDRIVPQGCPPNAATQRLIEREDLPASQYETPMPSGRAMPVQPPLPQEQADAITNIALAGGKFDVMLMNNTNTLVSYEVIGHTQRRYLQGGEQVMLQGIPAPATIAMTRPDNGFVDITPVSGSAAGVLTISLDEDESPRDQSQGVLSIEPDGQVFLN